MSVEAMAPTSAQHVENPSYSDAAPTGGPHKSCWLAFGVYQDPLDPGLWVHNLEHGGIVLLYDCMDGCPAETEQLVAFGMANARTIVAPAVGLPAKFAIMAWGYRLLGDCLDLGAVTQFYQDHFNRALEDVASGPPSGC